MFHHGDSWWIIYLTMLLRGEITRKYNMGKSGAREKVFFLLFFS